MGPNNIIWDVTYACPLRCTHCYSESGRRPSRQLRGDDLLRVADAIIALRPENVVLAGGEPLLVDGIFKVAGRLKNAGIHVIVYTGGWSLRPSMVEDLVRVCDEVTVSVDGATAEVHDRIRGRKGSFDRALAALHLIDAASPGEGFTFGIDSVVVRSNFDDLDLLCSTIPQRFGRLGYLSIGAAIPSGLASRIGFAEHELPTDEQVAALGGAELPRRLQALAPPSVRVSCRDNLDLQMNPAQLAADPDYRPLVVEPDGEVRGMPIYEGTVGNLLTEPGEVLWERSMARWSDPLVTEILSGIRTMREWSEATRRLDYHFASERDRLRIDRRPAFR
ncbi:Radical SAM superfamily enzyme, MoaA/NifB/PqqE/SkfB family [Amycolatopsis xylanica]|uniref:Radical SAM superfamily enzyme, MoaA/NifB/PqqE/SkfB family n=1 Tax=Amycolatopsis xylanica TaxID=589385 RepID=A0A1H3N1N6_9PSEU|nr:radical SAM protein [Amycolatopsis xylanica]SDY82640.1 Radical SAM superfamily enzyme, MoaA/NifB/PqqE/SkfB family [Amycolatopsis xylanica]